MRVKHNDTLRSVSNVLVKHDGMMRGVSVGLVKVGTQLRVFWRKVEQQLRGWVFTSDRHVIKTSDGFYIRCSDQK